MEHRNTLSEFMLVTSSERDFAESFLKQNKWNLHRALENFFNTEESNPRNNLPKLSKVERKKVTKLFEAYKNEDEDEENEMIEEKIEDLCNDLGIGVDSLEFLVLSWKLKAVNFFEISRKEFIDGFIENRCYTLEEMKVKIPEFKDSLDNPKLMKDFYLYCFDFGLEEGQRAIGSSTAIELWRIILKDSFTHIDKWIEFIRKSGKTYISRDTWNLLLEFISSNDDNFSKYDPDDAWPVLIDEFIAYFREEENAGMGVEVGQAV